MLARFIFEEDGQTLVEYAFLISLIALIVVVAVAVFGTSIRDSLYKDLTNQLGP